MVPAFNGLGYAMVVVRFFVNIYYVVITAWSLFYLFVGFQSDLPWGSCTAEWSTYDCFTQGYNDICVLNNGNNTEMTFYMNNCTTIDEYCIGHNYEFGNYVSFSLKITILSIMLFNDYF
jgi:SNF family Na+-dependent transporter